MDIKQKRDAINGWCDSHPCGKCPLNDTELEREFCGTHTEYNAPDETIETWHKALGLPEEVEELEEVEVPTSTIKDSGDRTLFASGAVRDLSEGKGRMDLIPWSAVIEVSKHCENGAKKYGEHNVDKGIPVHSFIDSAFRHLAKHTEGWDDEPHLIAAAWNILWAIQTGIKHPELNDIPWKESDQCKDTPTEDNC
jgi:hypothetical protein